MGARRESAFRILLQDRPVAYHPCLARLAGSVTAGVLLAQMLYQDRYWAEWHQRKGEAWDGWFWFTRDDIAEQTALTRAEQETARRNLRQRGYLKEQMRGLPARMYYRLDIGRIETDLSRVGSDGDNPANKEATSPDSCLPESRQQEGDIPANNTETPQRHTHRNSEERGGGCAPSSSLSGPALARQVYEQAMRERQGSA